MELIHHIVAMPLPGRGSINPMMSLCRLLVVRGIHVTFVITEEWLQILQSDTLPLPESIHLQTIPNVIPSERVRADNFEGFVEGVRTKLEAPFEELLDRLESQVDGILADSFMPWVGSVGCRRNIKVFSLFTQSAAVFTVFWHYDLFQANAKLPIELSERGEECVDYIPGIGTSTTLADLHSICFCDTYIRVVLECFPCITKSQCVLFPFLQELEPQVVDYLKANFPVPIYPVGPLIPFMVPEDKPMIPKSVSMKNKVNYYTWLDSQPKNSVLYLSLGSLHTPCQKQMEEIAKALRDAEVSYLWVIRQNTSDVNAEYINSKKGLVIPWCEQLRVLCHPSVGGFFSHCGWNSTLETIYAGVPVLAFPLAVDQFPNTKLLVDDWKVGVRLRRQTGKEIVTMSDKISKNMKMLMDPNGDESKMLRIRADELRQICQGAVKKGGSSYANLDAFVKEMVTQSSLS